MRPVKAVIFDCDGLLLDTESIYTLVSQEIFNRFGQEFTTELKIQFMGKKEEHVANLVSQIIPISPSEYLQQAIELQEIHFVNCKLLQGVQELIDHLVLNQVKIAVATSSHEASFGLKSRSHLNFFKNFSVIVLGDQVQVGKPDPEIFIACASRLQVDPKDCLVFEDSPNGVKAALAAGMQCVWVPEFEYEQEFQGVTVLKSIKEFQPELYGLPPKSSS